jgi:cytochrome oxidase Cu insertion factor (SCO1/SenC/PrrC family)
VNRYLVATIAVFISAIVAAAILSATGAIGSGTHDCSATQPVYSGTQNVGTWSVTLRPGQSVALPDGDRATCTTNADNNGLVIN